MIKYQNLPLIVIKKKGGERKDCLIPCLSGKLEITANLLWTKQVKHQAAWRHGQLAKYLKDCP